MEKDFQNKTVVITGASAGLGRAMVREFARHGANIGLIARGIDGLNAAQKEVEDLGSEALVVPADVSHANEVENAARKIEEHFGKIDVWINNAMVSVFAPFEKIEAKDFERVTDVTYLGQVYGTAAALKRMKPRNKGTIILVGSALAYRGIPLQSAYCGAKHGIQGFYDSLRTELMHDKSNIKTCMVQLPAMNTTQFGWVLSRLPNKPRPMGKVYDPEVAARAIVYAASHNRREIYVGYPTFKAIYGNKVAAWYADKVLADTGFDGQQTDQPESPDRPNNVWEPVHEDRGAYGNFAPIAHKKSFTLWVSLHRNLVRAIAGVAAAGLIVAMQSKRK